MIGLPFGLFGLKGMAIASAIAFTAGTAGGVWVTQKIYGYREARAVIKQLRIDNRAATELAEQSAARAKELAERDADNQGTIRDLTLEISKRVPADQCILTDDRARWLRELGRDRAQSPAGSRLRSTR